MWTETDDGGGCVDTLAYLSGVMLTFSAVVDLCVVDLSGGSCEYVVCPDGCMSAVSDLVGWCEVSVE